MLGNLPDVWVSILRDPYVVSIVAGMALLALPVACKRLGVWKRRRAAIEALRNFFRDWEAESIKTASDEDWQFVRHEQMIRRMNEHLTLIRPNLSNRQWADITELIRSHEELIEERRLFLPMATNTNDPVPPRFILLPWEYREFFERAIKIKWLKPGKEKPRKKAKMS